MRTEDLYRHRKEVLLYRHVWEGQLVVQEMISLVRYKSSTRTVRSLESHQKKNYKRNRTATAVKIIKLFILLDCNYLFVCFPVVNKNKTFALPSTELRTLHVYLTTVL